LHKQVAIDMLGVYKISMVSIH